MPEPRFEAVYITKRITQWLTQQIRAAGMEGGIVGLSGGIDSAVVAALLQRTGYGVQTVIMPCHSDQADAQDARLVAERLELPCCTVPLDAAYNALVSALPEEEWRDPKQLSQANIKPRLRMVTLYALAQERRYLVCGTGNKIELSIGYFTKFGDSGCDLLPLGDLVKCEVNALGRHLGVPESVLDKPPSAGLWAGQTDEDEMGLSYSRLDAFLLGESEDPEAAAFVQRQMARSEHKRTMPPICTLQTGERHNA
ncbi:MAG: NAD(+) synthase [Synergistales bacterium]|nr:NAD(+) synthase [Synergistales bacterium]